MLCPGRPRLVWKVESKEVRESSNKDAWLVRGIKERDIDLRVDTREMP